MHPGTIPPRRDEDVVELVRAARTGDDDAWARLVGIYNGMLHARLRRFRLSREDTQDVVQNTWLLAIQNVHRLRQEALFGSWLAAIATRESLKLIRRSREICTGDATAIDRADDNVAAADRELARTWLTRTLDDVVEELPDCHRLLFRALTEAPRPRYAEVARKLGRPLGSIGPSRARCFGRLRGLLEDREIRADFLD